MTTLDLINIKEIEIEHNQDIIDYYFYIENNMFNFIVFTNRSNSTAYYGTAVHTGKLNKFISSTYKVYDKNFNRKKL